MKTYKLTVKTFSRYKNEHELILKLFKKKLKRKKSSTQFTLFLGCLHTSENKLLKTAILLVQEHIVWEEMVFGLTLTFIFLIIGECEKGKLYILKKLDLIKFKRYYEIMYVTVISCFLTYFYFIENLHINF